MTKEQAKMQAKQFWNSIVVGSAIWGFICFAIQMGCYFFCINKCMKSQAILENKYMGPEIVPVQPTARQVAATAATAQEPVIQYIVTPPVTQAPQVSGTGNIVTANQIV